MRQYGQAKVQLTLWQEKPNRGCQKEQGKRRRHLCDEGEDVPEAENESEGTWTWHNPSTYPDRLLNISCHLAVMEIRNRMLLPLLDSIMFCQGIHLLEGVSVPHEVATKLCLGFCFGFSTEPNNTIVVRDYEYICNTICWTVHFNDKVRIMYDHRYDLTSRSSSTTPMASVPIEAGLAEGRSVLL